MRDVANHVLSIVKDGERGDTFAVHDFQCGSKRLIAAEEIGLAGGSIGLVCAKARLT